MGSSDFYAIRTATKIGTQEGNPNNERNDSYGSDYD
jgi:hypothetical protein